MIWGRRGILLETDPHWRDQRQPIAWLWELDQYHCCKGRWTHASGSEKELGSAENSPKHYMLIGWWTQPETAHDLKCFPVKNVQVSRWRGRKARRWTLECAAGCWEMEAHSSIHQTEVFPGLTGCFPADFCSVEWDSGLRRYILTREF